MAVVHRYRPTLYDFYEDLLTWLDRREGPAVMARSAPADSRRSEREHVRALSSPELIGHLAARCAHRRPSEDELVELLGLANGTPGTGEYWYRNADHPLLTGAAVTPGGGRRLRQLRFWSHDETLSVPVSFLVGLLGKYGGTHRRLVRDRDGDTEFSFRSFRGGGLKRVIARTPVSYYSPFDDHEAVGEELASTLEASGRPPEGHLLAWDRDSREYRVVSEDEVYLRSFTFVFELAGKSGPYGLYWLRKRSLYVRD